MDPELKALIASPEFRQYHEKWQSPTFSPFDVLQVADVEIRHSNVLAWLLKPNGTHGIGGGFLRALVEHLTRRHDDPSLRSLTGFDDEDNVEVNREDYHDGWYADITVGFKAQGVLLIIENKLVGWYRESEQQVKDYQKALPKKYKGRYVHFPGVLLTTSDSPEGRAAERDTRDIMPLSWEDVGGIIRSLLEDQENFAGDHVRGFVKGYLDVIEERLIYAGDDLAERLRNDHPRILARLQEENRRGERAVLDEVDEPQRATVQRWVEYFEERPAKLREEVAERLKQRGGAGIKRIGGRGGYKNSGWLHWWETPPSGKDLGIGDCLWWLFTFEPRSVTVELGTPWESNPKNPNMQKIWEFMQHTPIDLDTKRFPRGEMKHRIIYRHNLLNEDELSGPFEKTVKLLHDRLDEFFGRDGDYERIERYFRCLAFDPRGPQPDAGAGEAESPAPTAS